MPFAETSLAAEKEVVRVAALVDNDLTQALSSSTQTYSLPPPHPFFLRCFSPFSAVDELEVVELRKHALG